VAWTSQPLWGLELEGLISLSSIPALASTLPAVASLLATLPTAYMLLLVVTGLIATLHPDRYRRADARHVFTALLTALRSGGW
jgi:hypothetical protein